ncbi:MAG: hypothetical protein LBF51_04635 [Zoogloeaceae bacterium]|nr:hypothetical protein [Zoogloeaceae bacterium]
MTRTVTSTLNACGTLEFYLPANAAAILLAITVGVGTALRLRNIRKNQGVWNTKRRGVTSFFPALRGAALPASGREKGRCRASRYFVTHGHYCK